MNNVLSTLIKCSVFGGVQSTLQQRKSEIGEMKKGVDEKVNKIGMKKENSTKTTEENLKEVVTKRVDNTEASNE